MPDSGADTLWLVLPAAQRASGEWLDDTLCFDGFLHSAVGIRLDSVV